MMKTTQEAFLNVTPIVTPCAYKMYLAVSPEGSPLRIGVLGGNELEARRRFKESIARWAEILYNYEHSPDIEEDQKQER